MITICWSAKGGSGTTVIATSLGLLTTRSLLVDLAGDIATALGLDVGDRPGVLDWLGSDAPAEHLRDSRWRPTRTPSSSPSARLVSRAGRPRDGTNWARGCRAGAGISMAWWWSTRGRPRHRPGSSATPIETSW